MSEGSHAEPSLVVQAAELEAQLQALGAEKADVAAALESLQVQHTAAGEAASQAAAAAAQAISQLEAQRAGLEEKAAGLNEAAQEHARYQQELEGAVPLHAAPRLCPVSGIRVEQACL